MQSSPSASADIAKTIVSCWYAVFVLAIPGFVFALKVLAYVSDPDMRAVSIWKVPVEMPSWYIIGYFCVLAGAVFVLPTAFTRSRALGLFVVCAMAISVVAMIPVIFVPKLYLHP